MSFTISRSECFDMIRRLTEDLYLNRLKIENILPEYLQLFSNNKKKKYYSTLTQADKDFILAFSKDTDSSLVLFDALVEFHCPHPDDIYKDKVTHGGLTSEEYRIFDTFHDEVNLNISRVKDYNKLIQKQYCQCCRKNVDKTVWYESCCINMCDNCINFKEFNGYV